jgi:hypothetical protein
LYLITIFFLNTHSKRITMEPSSSSGESIRSIETYVTAANHPMPAILKARCVILLCGLFGVRRSHDRCTPFIAETNRPNTLWLTNTWYEILVGNSTCHKLFSLICLENFKNDSKIQLFFGQLWTNMQNFKYWQLMKPNWI